MNNDRAHLIRERLSSLEPSSLEIIDESHLHAGHAGSQSGASHFRVNISSMRFQGLNRLEQQRLVLATLQDLIPYPIHALALHTSIPSSSKD